MRILLTNDDGISAPGLEVAEAIAQELAGPTGEVWVVAPAFEQSGVAHSVSYVRPMRLERIGERRFAVEGSPADCVLAGLGEIIKGGPPDLVISGVNRGHNVAEDTLYSGTVGGALEGALHGVRSVALSQYHGPRPRAATALRRGARPRRGPPAPAPRRRGLAGDALCGLLQRQLPAGAARRPCAAPARPSRATAPAPTFGVLPHVAPNGRTFLWLTHGHGNADTAEGSDSRECHDGFITVTPLVADLTAHDLIAPLAQALG